MATLTTPPLEAAETEHPLTAANEPSMEDILASIRRIIAEDQTNSLGRPALGSLGRTTARSVESGTPATAVPPAPEDHGGPDLAPAAEPEPMIERQADVFAVAETHHPDEPALVDAPTPGNAGPPYAALHDAFVAAELATPHHEPVAEERPLISAGAQASVTSSFHALAESMLLQDKAMVERLTREELRPLLTSWLDDNLPSIVERLVRSEIERVARGGRG